MATTKKLIMKNQMYKQYFVNVNYDLAEFIDNECAKNNISVSEYLRRLIKEDKRKKNEQSINDLMSHL